ncbi:MAG TPA: glycosyltransferase [Dokdonella sp.]|uniref:glycosyltransferase n=1 Tax=Dokdonella sp. TaxID=2291710 RepID=UPI002C748A02|nr:glycosyltransferase [Dokdonella sp.]HUD43022.1 glycosyltransferase [Dokdonella sp.]
MRILHVGKYYAPQRGGIERCTQDLAEWAVAHGHAAAALVHQPAGVVRASAEHIGRVEVVRAGCVAAPLYTPLSPAFALHLARLIDRFRPDVLHLHLPNPSAFWALTLPSARRLPWVAHWHAEVPTDTPDWRLRAAYRVYRPFEQALLARAAAIVTTSEAYAAASRALAPWRAKTRAIPLGIGEAPAVPAAPPDWPGGVGLRLLAVGRLSAYKGFDVLLEALARCAGARLLLIGDGEEAPRLRALAARLGLADRVRFAGAVDDATLAAAYAAADLVVLPSLDRGEAFGVVLLEAMRAGRAVIASDVAGSGISSVVGADAGVLVPPGDAAALAAAIAALAADPARRRALGEAGRARWRERFTLAHAAGPFLALYAELMAAR